MKKSFFCLIMLVMLLSSVVTRSQSTLVFENDTVKVGWTFNKNSTSIETPTLLTASKYAVTTVKADVSAFKLNGTRTTTIEDASRVTFTRLQVKADVDPVVTWTVTPTEGLSYTPTYIKMTIYVDNTDEALNAVVVKANGVELGTFTPLRNGKTLSNDPNAGAANLTSFVEFALTPEQKTALTVAGAFNLTATMNIPSGKDGGFTNIQVIGVVNGELNVPAISPEQQDALDDAVAAANAIKDEYMNSAAKAELDKQLTASTQVDGLDIDAVTTALNAAVTAAQASIDAYAPFVAAVTDAEATLAIASADADGYYSFKSAVNTARSALDSGTPTNPTSNIKALTFAINTFIVAGASPEAPKDATSFIQNPTFADTLGWTITNPKPENVTITLEPAGTLGFTSTYFKAVDNVETNGRGLFKNFAVEQTIENIPNGDYYLSADVYFEELGDFGRDYLYLYAGEKSAQCKRATAEGPATTKVKVRVSNNTLTIKLASTADRNDIIAFSNFKLKYVNFESWAPATVNNDDNTVVVSVNSAEAFADIFKMSYPEGADVTINLNSGTYDLGTNGSQTLPTHHGNVAFVGNGSVTIKGGFRSSNGLKVKDYRFENLNFVAQDNASTESSAFYFYSGGDDVTGQMIINNCTFTNLPASIIRAKSGHVHEYVLTNNTFDGNGHHFVQLQNGHQREGFIFKENIVKNFVATGGQFFSVQLPANPAAYTDSTFNMVVENNIFYKIGGQAANVRHFIECNNANKYKEVTFNVNNNIFWELYKDTLFRNTNLALFTADPTQKVTFNLLNNLIYPDDMMTNIWDPNLGDGQIKNFPVISGNIVPNQRDLFVETLGIMPEEFWRNADSLIIAKSSPTYIAGTNRSYLGTINNYRIEDLPVIVKANSYTREYGEANPTFDYSIEGPGISGEPEIICEATDSSRVGVYPIIIRKGSVTNLNDSYVNGTLTITKAPLTISVGQYSRKQAVENPTFEIVYRGFKNGENDSVLSSKPEVHTLATVESEPGSYPITLSGASARNYDIQYEDGVISIERTPFTINYYIDSVLIRTKSVMYGTPIYPASAPFKEGHTFMGWSAIPDTMPAHNLDIQGSFSPNDYTLTWVLDGNVFDSDTVTYGTNLFNYYAKHHNMYREGYTFSGWQLPPITLMPSYDIVIEGSYSVNYYPITWMVDGEIYKKDSIAFGSVLEAEDTPVKLGYTFSGWSEIPTSMPAHGLDIQGSFSLNNYLLTWMLDGNVFDSDTVPYGTGLFNYYAKHYNMFKEGYTFSGWKLPQVELMPSYDIVIEGSYSVNYYPIIWTVDGETYKIDSVAFGSALVVEDTPVKPGYTFSGWSEIPATMPAHGLDIQGSFSLNNYALTWVLNGVVYDSDSVPYGTNLFNYYAKHYNMFKEGYTFSGWQLPSITLMPSYGLVIEGSYSVNYYPITWMVDGEIYKKDSIAFGSALVVEAIPVKLGCTFSGWSEVPATMPAREVVISGTFTYDEQCAVPEILYEKGELTFSCATEGAEIHSNIIAPDAASRMGAKVTLDMCYYVDVCATAEGYAPSDTVSIVLLWREVEAGPVEDGIQVGTIPVVVYSRQHIVHVLCEEEGTPIEVYTPDGRQVARGQIVGGVAEIDTHLDVNSLVVVKVGTKTVKLVLK